MTKQEAEAKLATMPLDRPVAVSDVADAGKGARQLFVFATVGVNATLGVEIDATPTPAQLDTLALHLPVPDDKRTDARAKLAADAKDAAIAAGR